MRTQELGKSGKHINSKFNKETEIIKIISMIEVYKGGIKKNSTALTERTKRNIKQTNKKVQVI